MSDKKAIFNPKSADRIKTLIKESGLTQGEFAAKIFYTQQHLSKIVTGKAAVTPDVAFLIQHEIFPQIDIAWIMGESDYRNDTEKALADMSSRMQDLSFITNLLGLSGYELSVSPDPCSKTLTAEDSTSFAKNGYTVVKDGQTVGTIPIAIFNMWAWKIRNMIATDFQSLLDVLEEYGGNNDAKERRKNS